MYLRGATEASPEVRQTKTPCAVCCIVNVAQHVAFPLFVEVEVAVGFQAAKTEGRRNADVFLPSMGRLLQPVHSAPRFPKYAPLRVEFWRRNNLHSLTQKCSVQKGHDTSPAITCQLKAVHRVRSTLSVVSDGVDAKISSGSKS